MFTSPLTQMRLTSYDHKAFIKKGPVENKLNSSDKIIVPVCSRLEGAVSWEIS